MVQESIRFKVVVCPVDIPVIAAGGIGDGRGFAAAFMLGAEGVQMGTRFVTAKESNAHQAYKNEILNARDSSTVVTGRSTGHSVRVIKNKLTRQMLQLEKRGADPEEIVKLGTGALRSAVVDGNVERGSVMAGQISGLVKKEQTAQEIIEDIMRDAADVFRRRNVLAQKNFGA